MRSLAFCGALGLVACGHAVVPVPPDLATVGEPGLRAMSPEALEATTRYLSADALAGRAPGTPGGVQAEQYVADQLARLGLVPAGDAGTFFQAVPLRRARLVGTDNGVGFHAHGTDIALELGRDAMVWPDPRTPDVDIEAPLVFAGYGISRPDLGYDDLADLDVKGAIVLIYGGAPRMLRGQPIASTLHAVLADSDHRSRLLRERGARAVIVARDPLLADHVPFATFASVAPTDSLAWLARGKPASDPVLPTATIDDAGFERVLAATKHAPHARELWTALDGGEPARVDLRGARARLRIHSALQDVTARNVVARLPGSDPAVAAETVVYSAHLDHLGVGAPVDGDAIYNGAIDNAIGVAAVIEIARAFAALPVRPRRSILILVTTAEEAGLLGSEYFARHPTVPLASLVADVNLDTVSAAYEPFDAVPLGMEHSTLGAHVQAAARARGFAISAEPAPEEERFIRSDQYSFVKQGVPAVFPIAGTRDAHGDTATNHALLEAYFAQRYHQPSDVWLPDYRATWAIKEVGFDFLLGLSIATAPARPRWNAGDVFEPH